MSYNINYYDQQALELGLDENHLLELSVVSNIFITLNMVTKELIMEVKLFLLLFLLD